MRVWILLFLGAVSPGQPSYEKANALFIAQRFPEALAAVEEAIQLDARLVPALTLKAKLAMAASRWDVAGKSLEQALAVDPKAAYAQFLYGMVAYMNNEMGEASTRFQKARVLAPKDPRAALYLGLTIESVGKPGDALALYEEAVRLEGASGQQDAGTLLPGARLLLLLGRLEESESWVRQALKLSPKMRDGHFELARILLKKGDSDAAAQAGELALSLPGASPADAAIHYLLVRAWRQAGKPERAAFHAAVLRAKEN
jgi:tetratricopeptide (TPR) repeat protein